MSEPKQGHDMRLDTIDLLQELATEAATYEVLADELDQLRDIAEQTGSPFGPVTRLIARSHRVRALDLRGRSAAVAEMCRRTLHDLG